MKIIRKFELNDLDTVMTIWLQTNISAHDFIDESYWQSNFEMVKQLIPTGEIYVYEEGSELVGFIGLMDSFIAGIFVNQQTQSKGIGAQLLNQAKVNHEQLTLSVYEKNKKAIQFYERHDFITTAQTTCEHTNEPELQMTWTKDRSNVK